MKALTRYAAPAAVLVGLTIAFAPAAVASPAGPGPTGPVTKINQGTSTFTAKSACNDYSVTTAGLAAETITTDGPKTEVTFADAETGDGFTFTEAGTATFYGTKDVYQFQVPATWYNDRNPFWSFHGWVTVDVTAAPGNQPTGFTSTVKTTACGL